MFVLLGKQSVIVVELWGLFVGVPSGLGIVCPDNRASFGGPVSRQNHGGHAIILITFTEQSQPANRVCGVVSCIVWLCSVSTELRSKMQTRHPEDPGSNTR